MTATSRLIDYMGRGLAADLPAPGGITFANATAALYWATDTETLYLLNDAGTAWQTISIPASGVEVSDGTHDFTAITKILFSGATVSNPATGEAEVTISGGGGSGAFVKLGEAIASGGSTTVLTVSGIPATSKDMKIILTGAINGGSNPEIDLTFNGDTSAIYDWRWSQQFGSNSGSSDTKIYAAQLANSNFPSPGTTECTLAGYASTVFNKYMSGVANVRTGTGGNNIIPWTWEAEYLSTAAINEVTMTAAGGAPFRDGTRLTIYGMG